MASKKHQNKQIKEKQKGKKKREKQDNKKEEQYLEDIIDADENTAKDFQFLLNAPVSEDDHFVFKSEKNWTTDTSKYSEFFTLDLKTLSAAIESIPFNENINIDAKYFTDDQLTNIYNNANQGKEKYNKLLSNTEINVTNDTKTEEETQDLLGDTADDLDFLLSLQEPVNDPSITVNSSSSSFNIDSRVTTKSSTSTKPLDLEKWLDSVLDD
ncbi:hypothetical protein ANTQUA_LOCUS3618 [Anthophora quadrimaculata]